jgi:prepilin-type N-terminal cleavage/methylation domain-containing protein
MSFSFHAGLGGRRSAAFTLIEIMMVVAIMGIIMLIAIPSVYYQFNKESLRKAVEDMCDAATQARSKAILDQRKTTLSIFPTSVRAPGFNAKFSESIVIDKLWLHGEDYTDKRTVRTEAQVEFHPDGTCDAAVIGMRRVDTNERCEISLEAVTGLVDVEWDAQKMRR